MTLRTASGLIAILFLGTTALSGTLDPLQQNLKQTVDDLAAIGYKRAGTAPALTAANYVASRMAAIGLQGIHMESFQFPRFQLLSSSLAITDATGSQPMTHDVFAYSGVGQVSAPLVDVGFGHPDDYIGKIVAGRTVLLERDPTFHRSSQYREVIAHGGAAMIYISTSPNNLIQIGAVTDPEDGLGPIPAVTIGADDGAALRSRLQGGLVLLAAIDVSASVTPGTGRNVIGSLPGQLLGGPSFLIGAHYDTWQIGSIDNGSGVAGLFELARYFAACPPLPYGLVFVAYDGEEPGLFGGYDYLRDHIVNDKKPIAAFVNLEIPGSGPTDIRALARTTKGPIDEALDAVGIRSVYDAVVNMELVPLMFGGIIPTDIQGTYRYGVQGFSTACDTPYYHTVADTPDKLDYTFLAKAITTLAAGIDTMSQSPPSAYNVRDDALYRLDVTRHQVAQGLDVDVSVTDSFGNAVPLVKVSVWLDVDDFTRVFRSTMRSDGAGRLTVQIPATELSKGSGQRFIHVTAGMDYPLAETILPLSPTP